MTIEEMSRDTRRRTIGQDGESASPDRFRPLLGRPDSRGGRSGFGSPASLSRLPASPSHRSASLPRFTAIFRGSAPAMNALVKDVMITSVVTIEGADSLL